MGSKSLIRSRWAAIGAAVAVTLGGGGLIGVSAASGDASSLKTVTPTRIMDTRQGTDGKVSGETVALQVTGEITTYASNGSTPAATVVPAGANAVSLNLTVTEGERNQGYGFVTAFPCTAVTDTVPNASTLNFVEGVDVANSTVVPLGATGKICLNVYGSAHLIIDANGYYETATSGAGAVDAYTKAESDAKYVTDAYTKAESDATETQLRSERRGDRLNSYTAYSLIDREVCDAFEATAGTSDDCRVSYNWDTRDGLSARLSKPSGYGFAYAHVPLDAVRAEGNESYVLKAVGFCISGWSGQPQAGDGASIAKLSVMSGEGDTISDEILSGLAAPSTITIISTDDEPAVEYGDGSDATGCFEAEIPTTHYIDVGRS
ncbi:MAG: hypothetical protein ACO3ME_09460, partial [Ilumatobacteraceae bacterium]